jgi:SAM-dependent methyltransferase
VPDELKLSGHAARTRAMWNADAPNWVDLGRKAWEHPGPSWGQWDIPEDELRILRDVEGLDVLDLAAAPVTGAPGWREWARVRLDSMCRRPSSRRRALQREHGLDFPLLHASAEATSLPDRSFDLVFSEYGAAIWCDPYARIPEACRLLRPGGRLIFLCNSVVMMLCSPPSEEPAGETLVRPQFGLHRIDWPDTEGPDFHLPHGEMLRLLREAGFEVEALHELQAPEGPEDEVRFYLRRGWARRWPGEEVRVARRRPA